MQLALRRCERRLGRRWCEPGAVTVARARPCMKTLHGRKASWMVVAVVCGWERRLCEAARLGPQRCWSVEAMWAVAIGGNGGKGCVAAVRGRGKTAWQEVGEASGERCLSGCAESVRGGTTPGK